MICVGKESTKQQQVRMKQHQQRFTKVESKKTTKTGFCCCCSNLGNSCPLNNSNNINKPPKVKLISSKRSASEQKAVKSFTNCRPQDSARRQDSEKSEPTMQCLEGAGGEPCCGAVADSLAPVAGCVKCELIVRWTREQAAQLRVKKEGPQVAAAEEARQEAEDSVSSLTSNSFSEPEEDNWSLLSGYEINYRKGGVAGGSRTATPPPPAPNKHAARSRQPPPQSTNCAPAAIRRKPRRLAPKPPEKEPRQQLPATVKCQRASDSGNTSGGDTSQHSASGSVAAARKANEPASLLSELEVYSIERCLKSYKSSVYVCGCMANLYLTSTRLVDNGRCSKPAAEGWRLSKTGVPVLTFDSGLTRNRSRRRLSINLAERDSGFVLWSDTIDHLSNYGAFDASKHGNEAARENGAEEERERNTCDTFHVMYLSSNHRIMIGLSFDDSTCAKLFLRQVELVTSDPANISLTGPKLTARLPRLAKLALLLSKQSGKQQAPLKGAKSSGSIASECRRLAQTNNESPQQQRTHSNLNISYSSSQEEAATAAAQRRFSRLSNLILTGGGGATQSNNQNCTWSTLKRAMKFSRQESFFAGLDGQSANSQAPAAAAAHFKPKPLASLAAAGRNYRSGKRLPRKCDISAPCLFEHVTRVDESSLGQLYSKSLLAAASNKASPIREPSYEEKCEPADRRQPEQQSLTSAGSSCYSSASISPASSECGPPPPIASKHTRPRPLPPKVPQRKGSSPGREEAMPTKTEPDKDRGAAPLPDTKIKAIMRDLQAQTSAELVDAKRKLMADIADQVVARCNASKAASAGIVLSRL